MEGRHVPSMGQGQFIRGNNFWIFNKMHMAVISGMTTFLNEFSCFWKPLTAELLDGEHLAFRRLRAFSTSVQACRMCTSGDVRSANQSYVF